MAPKKKKEAPQPIPPAAPTPVIVERINPFLKGLERPLGWFKPDPQNARKHDQRSLDAITSSLRAFGQQKPVVALEDGTVIAGNGTLSAATSLGWPTLAGVVFADVSRARAYAIADNRSTELSEWNDENLAQALKELTEQGISMDGLGFSSGDMEDLAEFRTRPFQAVTVSVSDLKPHPSNYRNHPSDQLEHIVQSIKLHGFYRNVVVARDNTILAGHGVVQAVTKMGKKRVPVIRLDIAADDPRALKVLTSDNEISNLAQVDDRALTELLKSIMGTEDGLSGTGFNEKQLAALAFVTRPESEIRDKVEASEWVGMPQFIPEPSPFRITISFRSVSDRASLLSLLKMTVKDSGNQNISFWYPEAERRDVSSVAFKQE